MSDVKYQTPLLSLREYTMIRTAIAVQVEYHQKLNELKMAEEYTALYEKLYSVRENKEGLG